MHADTFITSSSFNPHTHAGCDFSLARVNLMSQSFNPHTHAGCDYVGKKQGKTFGVSIHTPTQGVTSVCWKWIWFPVRFQSTHPRRVWRREAVDDETQQVVSIHTPTQGVTPKRVVTPIDDTRFNPHTHAGCDTESFTSRSLLIVSIHTPTQGVTNSSATKQLFYTLFQSTHPRRVWRIDNITLTAQVQFQSTHPRRVWHSLYI